MPLGHVDGSHLRHHHHQRHHISQKPQNTDKSNWQIVSHSIQTAKPRMEERNAKKRKLTLGTGDDWVMTYRESPLGDWVLGPPAALDAKAVVQTGEGLPVMDIVAAALTSLPKSTVSCERSQTETKKMSGASPASLGGAASKKQTKLKDLGKATKKSSPSAQKGVQPKEKSGSGQRSTQASGKSGVGHLHTGGATKSVAAVTMPTFLQNLESTINEVATHKASSSSSSDDDGEPIQRSVINTVKQQRCDSKTSAKSVAKNLTKKKGSLTNSKLTPHPSKVTNVKSDNYNKKKCLSANVTLGDAVKAVAVVATKGPQVSRGSKASATNRKTKCRSPDHDTYKPPAKKLKVVKSTTAKLRSSPKRITAAALKKKGKAGGLGFWKGARLRRMASLNAQAKVHILYENEARPPNQVDEGRGQISPLMAPASPTTDDSSSCASLATVLDLSKNILGGKGGSWTDQETTPLLGKAAKKVMQNRGVAKGKSSVSKALVKVKKVPVQKGKKQVARVGKQKKGGVALSRKLTTVPKRMASLNAQAILAASYSLERSTRSTKEKTVTTTSWVTSKHIGDRHLTLTTSETKPIVQDNEEAMPAFYPPSPLNYVVQHIAAIKEDTIRQVIDAVAIDGIRYSDGGKYGTPIVAMPKNLKTTATSAKTSKKSIVTKESKTQSVVYVKETASVRHKKTIKATTAKTKGVVCPTVATIVKSNPVEDRGRHKKKKRCSCCEETISERRSSTTAATTILVRDDDDDDLCLKGKADDLVSQMLGAAEMQQHTERMTTAVVKAEEVRRDKIEEDTAEVTITGMYINPMTNTSQSFCISRIHTYKQASSTHSFAPTTTVPSLSHQPSAPHGISIIPPSASAAAPPSSGTVQPTTVILQQPPVPVAQQQQQHHATTGGSGVIHSGHGAGAATAQAYPYQYATSGGSQPCGMGSVPLVDARHYSSAFAVPHYGHHGTVSYAPHGYYQTTGPMLQALPDPCLIHKPVPFHPHPFSSDSRCSTTAGPQPLQPFPTPDQCHSHPAPPYPPPGPGPGGQSQPAPLPMPNSAAAGHQQQQLLSPPPQSAVSVSLQQQPAASQLYPSNVLATSPGGSHLGGPAPSPAAAPPCGIHSQSPSGGADSKCNISLGPAAAPTNGLLPGAAPELYFPDGSCQSCVAAAMAAAVVAEHYARPTVATVGSSPTAPAPTQPVVPAPPPPPPPPPVPIISAAPPAHQQYTSVRARNRIPSSSTVVAGGTTSNSTNNKNNASASSGAPAVDPYSRMPPTQPDVGRQNALPTQTKTDHALSGRGRPLFAPKIVKVESVSESSVSVASTSSSSSESDERELGSGRGGRLRPLNLSIAKGYDSYGQPTVGGARHHMTTRRVKSGGTFGSPPSPSMAVGVLPDHGGNRGNPSPVGGDGIPSPPTKDSAIGQRRNRRGASAIETRRTAKQSKPQQEQPDIREVRVALSAEDVFKKSMVASWLSPASEQSRRQKRRKKAESERQDRRLVLRRTLSPLSDGRRAGCRTSGQQTAPQAVEKSPSPTRPNCPPVNGALDNAKISGDGLCFSSHLVVTRSSRATADSTPIQKREGLRARDSTVSDSSASRGRSPSHFPNHMLHQQPSRLHDQPQNGSISAASEHSRHQHSNHRRHQGDTHPSNIQSHGLSQLAGPPGRGPVAVFYGGSVETTVPGQARRSSSSASSTCSSTSSLAPGHHGHHPDTGVPRPTLSLRSTVSNNNRKIPRYSNGWMWDGSGFQQLVYLSNDDPPVLRKCYPAMRHVQGDVIGVRDCVLLRSGPRKNDLPFVAKVAALWENPEDGEMMFSLLWYYRPEHTEQGRKAHHMEDEIFASKHRDTNSVACIEDKCYVLTFNEYSRHRCRTRMLEEGLKPGPSVIPQPSEEYPRLYRQPPGMVSSDMAFFCRRVYEFRQKRILKNPS